MPSLFENVRILLIRPWTEPIAPVREALRDAGLTARITSVDIEPALNAALLRGSQFDLVLYDPATRGISREVVEARLRDHRRALPLVTLGCLDEIAVAIRSALAMRRN